MITDKERKKSTERAIATLKKANIVITDAERQHIEVADFGLGEIEKTGLQILTYINTDRVCAKEMVLLPNQTCPEHTHRVQGDNPGKEETFRCRWGVVYLYVDGLPTQNCHVKPPEAPQGAYTVFHEIELKPGEQYTIMPGTKHWFQSGANGAVVSEFSTHSADETDTFTDGRVVRVER